MDGPGITNGLSQKAAYDRGRECDSPISRGLGEGEMRPRAEVTFTGLVQSADELCGLIAELGNRLERVENLLAGPVPGEPTSSKDRASDGTLTDAIDGRLSRARMMLSLLHDKMGRIERRIG